MIELSDIKITETEIPAGIGGGMQLTARMVKTITHEISQVAMNNAKEHPEFKEHMMETVQQSMWRMIYGDLRNDFHTLLHLNRTMYMQMEKHRTYPSPGVRTVNSLDELVELDKIERRMKALLG